MTYIPADLRRMVIQRAGDCCEYCRIYQRDYDLAFHIEHIIAISHEGKTTGENLALSCPLCNTFKGSNVAAADPVTGDPTFLFHPRRQKWDEHFQLNGPFIEPLTPEGRVTVLLLRLNDTDRVIQRRALIQLNRYPCSDELQ